MQLITRDNLITNSFTNVREVLTLNSGTIPVTSSFSLNSPIPIIVINNNFDPINQYYGAGHKDDFNGIFNIRVVHKTDQEASTVAQELFTLLDTWEGTLDAYNITIIDKKVLPVSPLERGKDRYKVKPLIVSVVVDAWSTCRR